MKQEVCYLVCTVKDDLPVGCFDTKKEVMDFLEIKRTTFWKMETDHKIVRGMYVEKILL